MSSFLRTTPSRDKNGKPVLNEFGLIDFRLGFWNNDEEVSHYTINSGQPEHQALRTYADSKAGSHEPTPEGDYPLGSLAWAGKPHDYSPSFGPGLGPVWVPILSPRDLGELGFPDGRAAMGHHLDENRSYAPGTDGCSGQLNLDNLKRFVGDFEKYKPTHHVVDYGLGTVPGAPKKGKGGLLFSETPLVGTPIEAPQLAKVYKDGYYIDKVPIVQDKAVMTLGLYAKLHDLDLEWDPVTKSVKLTTKQAPKPTEPEERNFIGS